MKVVVIGAGLGGLTLAHGLRAAGHEVAVHERSPREGVQPASYGIHLNADGLRALHAVLPERDWHRFDADSMPAEHVVRFVDPVEGELAVLDFRTAEHAIDPITRRRAVTRGNLREALLRGLDEAGTVQWAHRFESYRELPDGRVEAAFADGGTDVGDLLVGADGSGSRLRSQRLPQLRRQDLGILNVAGRIALTPELERILPAGLTDGSINNCVPSGAGWMFASTWRTGDSAVAAREGDPAADRYVVWAWCAPAESYPRRGDLDPAALKAHVLTSIAAWSAPLRHLVAATPDADVGPVPLRTMPQLPVWTPSRVTLIGDAIHNMTPMGGVGANTALRDAEVLRCAVLAHPASPRDAVASYEREMRGYANRALRTSTGNALRAADPAATSRRAFRTLLRLAGRSDLVRRRVFHTPPASSLAR